MDVKSMAKSKRSHSQQNKRSHHHHPHQLAKITSTTGNETGKKLSEGKQIKEKNRPALPSNWERYQEEYDLGPGGDGTTSQIVVDDVIKPKSKGADYRDLINQAQTQQNTTGFSSFDEIIPELKQGLSSMISIRGQGILSCDDNFIVEDKAATSHEVPFFSLNLHKLAEQLANLDLSQRLFIDADQLPPELCSPGSKTGESEKCEPMQKTYNIEPASGTSERMDFVNFHEGGKTTKDDRGGLSSNLLTERIKEDGGHADQSRSRNFTANIKNSVLPTDTEAELDMLLDSISQPDSLYSSGSLEMKSTITSHVLQKEASPLQPPIQREAQAFSKRAPISDILDDSMDNLLRESSSLMKQHDPFCHKVTTTSLDDNIDDLLAETSNLMNPSGALQPQKYKASPLEINSSSSTGSSSKSKMLDDFDSWLETI